MEHLLTFLSTLTLILTASIVATDNPGAAEVTNAQAISGDSGSGSSASSDNLLLVRRYVPRFIGKRDQADADLDNVENTDITLEDDLSPMDEYVENLVDYYDDLDLSNLGINSIKDDSLGNFESTENDEFENEDGKDEDSLLETQEEKRYVPSFVGKRYGAFDDDQDEDSLLEKRYKPMFVGKRYKPMFVGKRYKPMFVGKRYKPMFVGKRYNPMFVGKRYNPLFVGKRYNPMFVGKRYQPKFIGKRYTPKFIGKRYTPVFVGKRYTPKFVGKRYTPKFIGKRYTPKFIGKRYTPKFIGKRFQPVFVGKKSEPTSNFLEKRYAPFFVGKRDQEEILDENNHVEKRSISSSNENSEDTSKSTERSTRKKRSLSDSNDDLKRAWGTYVPWKRNSPSAYRIPEARVKRFVAPEFIGRRDSLSTILSALDALQFAHSQPRSASKRFEAPWFIGKRSSNRPIFVGKKNQINTREMNLPNGYSDYDSIPGLPEVNFDAYEGIPNEYKLSPYRDIQSYRGAFPGSIDL